MTTLVLLRHGRSTANTAGVLAGRTAGVGLDELGLAQAAAVADRLREVSFARLITSPMQRCRQTIEPLALAAGIEPQIDDAFAEVDYGSWTGRTLAELGKEELWRTVQAHPSAAVFPEGESLSGMSVRAVSGVRALLATAGSEDVLLVCSHGDVIKAILADALGLHLDGFQRIVVAPASVSVVRYTPLRPFVEKINDTADFPHLQPPKQPPTDTPGNPEAGLIPESGPASNSESNSESNSASDAVPGGVAG